MDEFVKGKQLFVRVKGKDYPYDAKVSIYVDTTTGNWVVSTPMGTERTADLCAEMLDHFNEILEQQAAAKQAAADAPEPAPEPELPIWPMPTQDFH